MKTSAVVLCTLALLALGLMMGVAAGVEEAVAQTTAEPAASEDKTGTNPVNLQYEWRVSNEFFALPSGAVQNKTFIRYTVPLNQQPSGMRNMSVKVSLPFVTTDVTGETDFGYGDTELKWLWVAKLTQKNAVAFAVDSGWDTATKDSLGTGKNWLAPQAFYVLFLNPRTIFAPAFLYKFDIGGDDERADISQSIFDFYYVYALAPGEWLTIDPQLIFDHDLEETSGQVEIEYGRMMSGGMSFYLRPGFPVGNNEYMDWNLKVGLKSVF
ncbi:MAG: hypothetical protein JXA57_13545 [Armatimonadetes bacterium]|nr:hypothetical protein [Armatimonadota bacterium]